MADYPNTLRIARELREQAEASILQCLQSLQRTTGLDIANVEVILIVDATGDGEPQRRPHAVRIDLAV